MPTTFSLPQRMLHWAMFTLIVFNLLFSDGMSRWDRLVSRSEVPTAPEIGSANIHAYVGIAILVLAVIRVAVRLVQGAPAEPAQEPPVLQRLSRIGHIAFYALFFLMPLSGIARYYFGVELAGTVHAGPLKALMWILIALHVAAVAVHQFYWKTDVLKRMTRG